MIAALFRKQLKRYPWAIRLSRWYNTQCKYFDWRQALALDMTAWQKARNAAIGGPNVLLATCVGGHIASTNVESMLAVALTIRGCNVQFLLCDGILKACMGCEIQLNGRIVSPFKAISRRSCGICHKPALRHLAPLGLPVHGLGQYLAEEDMAEANRIARAVSLKDIHSFQLDSIPVGEHAFAGALRFVARGDLEAEPNGDIILRQYFHSSLVTNFALQRFLARYKPDTAVFNHGIYVPQGILGEVCRKQKVKVVNWNPAYRQNCFIFSHEDTYHHTMITEPNENWRHIKWNDSRTNQLMVYLKSRWDARNDWIWFHKKPNTDINEIKASTGIDFNKPTIGLLTSVVWDAALHYASNAFPSMLDWLFNTIAYFQKRQDLQLLIRVHPAEIQGGLPSRQRIVSEIKRRFPVLSDNIRVIGPDSNFSTYAMMLMCNSVIIYNTKAGIELSAYGIPIIVAGEAWVRNKGFTFDAHDPEEYHQILNRLPFEGRLSEDRKKLAQKYAYHFFFRRMIPLSYTAKSSGNPPYRLTVQRLSDLLPGSCRGLDTICDGIMTGSDFIYRESAISCVSRPVEEDGFWQTEQIDRPTSKCK
jgi:hypothetical protein